MEKLKMHSPDLTAENVKRLKELFPSVVTEGTDEEGNPTEVVDLDLLRQELSDHVVDGPKERYQLDWPGKRAALFAANAPIAKTLRPVREESVDFDATKNLFIEGDNLDALKLLQESYLGKVKLIYIDPPYNTGNDFVYDDDFAESTAEYLERSCQVSDEGERLIANTESNGRFHSDWLSMMLPRLRLARNLLSEDGVIFISIDDNELNNLVSLLAEVFGERNFIGIFSWVRTSTPPALSKRIKTIVEYVVAFERSNTGSSLLGVEKPVQSSNPLLNQSNTVRVLEFPLGTEAGFPDIELVPGLYGTESYDVELLDPVAVSKGRFATSFRLRGRFRWTQENLDREIKSGTLVRIATTRLVPSYEKETYGRETVPNLIDGRVNVGTNEAARRDFKDLMGTASFDYPKPVDLVKYLVNTRVQSGDTVMDFFAGSGTTAHAVMELNAEDNGDRRYVLVQMPEQTAEGSEARKAGFDTIADIARERIRRAAKHVAEVHPGGTLDTGFRALRVDTTSRADVLGPPDEVRQEQLTLVEASLKPDRTGEDLLFQVVLDWGLDLAMRIERTDLAGHEIFVVEDGALIACFDVGIAGDLVREIALRKPLRAVFRDAGFTSDANRINAEQVFAEVSPATDVKVI